MKALLIFITEHGRKVLKTLCNILRWNKRQCLEAFYAKGVFGIFSEPLLQRKGLNSSKVTMASMKNAAQNFCSRAAGRKSFVHCHFEVCCYRFWSYSWSLLFQQEKNMIMHSLRFVLSCSMYKRKSVILIDQYVYRAQLITK